MVFSRLGRRGKNTSQAAGARVASVKAPESYPPLTADELAYSILGSSNKSQIAIGLRHAAYLLNQEAQELGQKTTWNPDTLYDGVNDGSHRIAIALAAGACVRGVALAEPSGEGHALTHWYVVEKARGMGIGGRLLDKLGVNPPGIIASEIVLTGLQTPSETGVQADLPARSVDNNSAMA